MNSFEKGFLATFIGYWLGSKLDQTRFGIWFNTNPIIDLLWQLGKLILLLGIGVLVVWYFYILIFQT